MSHARDAAAVATYKVEPYVIAGDVYANEAQVGRGGWTWYTGSAGWMLRFVVESLLGVQRRAKELRLRPLLPKGWTTFEVSSRFGASRYDITCRRAEAAASVILDGVEAEGGSITPVDDGRLHSVVVSVSPRV